MKTVSQTIDALDLVASTETWSVVSAELVYHTIPANFDSVRKTKRNNAKCLTTCITTRVPTA